MIKDFAILQPSDKNSKTSITLLNSSIYVGRSAPLFSSSLLKLKTKQ